jgi:hypothetical protein
MLLSIDHLKGYKIEGADGAIGHVDSFLFEDMTWAVRYLVVDTTKFLFGNKVLIAPHCITNLDRNGLRVSMGVDEIRESPLIDTDKPVSRKMEKELHSFYGWPRYWETSVNLGMSPPPPPYPMNEYDEVYKENGGDPHLRSTDEVIRYGVYDQIDRIGTLNDFIVHTETWDIPFAVVDTEKVVNRKLVLIITDWIHDIQWEKNSVQVNVPRRVLERLPAYNPHEPINTVHEEVLYDYYGMPQMKHAYHHA